MTIEQQRIAIAEACGVNIHHAKFYHQAHGGMKWWLCQTIKAANDMHKFYGTAEHPVVEFTNPFWLPDYLSDLNAMHEAEKMLTPEQMASYANWLDVNSLHIMGAPISFDSLHATASQRAEAFLRTLNLWI